MIPIRNIEDYNENRHIYESYIGDNRDIPFDYCLYFDLFPAVASPSYKMDYIQSFGTAMYGNINVIVLFDSRTGQVWAYGINVEGEPSYLGKLTELGKPMVK